MPKATSVKLFLLSLLLIPGLTEAQVINEILYSPSTKQWVEIFNNTNADIDLSQYKILDAGAATNGHAIGPAQTGGPTVLPAGAVGIVAKDVTSVSASYLFKASLGIKTSGDTIALKKGTIVVDTTAFTDTADSGNSLQKFDTGWAQSTPTPGAANVLSTASPDNSQNSTSTNATTTDADTQAGSSSSANYSAHYSFVTAQNDTSSTFKASAGRDRLVMTREEVAFKAILNTNDLNTSYLWNFGDGSTGEGKEVTHAYLLAGDYHVVLNIDLFDNHAVSRANVKVVDPDLHVTASTNDYTEIHNAGKYEVSLYGWSLSNSRAVFKFPIDTIIGPGESIKFSSMVTKVGEGAVLAEKNIQLNVSSAAPMTATTTPASDHAHDREIQELSDKLVSLNLQVFAMRKPASIATTTSTPAAELPVVIPTSETAAAQTGWAHILKKFFTSQ